MQQQYDIKITDAKYDTGYLKTPWVSGVYVPMLQTELDSLSHEVKKIVKKAEVEAKETSEAISNRVNTELQDLNTLIKIDTSNMTRDEMQEYAHKSLDNIRHVIKQVEQEIYLWPKFKKWIKNIKYSTWGIASSIGFSLSTMYLINHLSSLNESMSLGYGVGGFIVGILAIVGFFAMAGIMFDEQHKENRIAKFEEDSLIVNYDGEKYLIKEYEYGHRDFIYVPLKWNGSGYNSYNKKQKEWNGDVNNLVKHHAKFNSEKTAVKFIKTGGLQHALRR